MKLDMFMNAVSAVDEEYIEDMYASIERRKTLRKKRAKVIFLAAAVILLVSASTTLFFVLRKAPDAPPERTKPSSEASTSAAATETTPNATESLPSSDEASSDYAYTKSAAGLTVKAKGTLSGTVEIPEEIDGLPVTAIAANGFEKQKEITEVILPASVTVIDAGAFRDCTSLVGVKAKGMIHNLGAAAFSGCTALVKADLPGDYKKIGWYTFENCRSLTAFYAPEGCEAIRENAFASCKALETIGIPSTIKTLEQGAFNDCSSLVNYDVSDVAAYCLCEGERPQGGDSAHILLKGVEITDLVLDDSVNSIMPKAFYKCENIKSVAFPAKNVTIDDGAFSGSGIESLVITKKMKLQIGAFSSCLSLRSIKIEEGVKSVKNAIVGCQNLQRLELPASLETIDVLGAVGSVEIVLSKDNAVFGSDGKALWQKSDGKLLCAAKGYIPQNSEVKIIPHNYCFLVELGGKLTIPEGIEIIEGSAFCKCSVTEVVLPSSLKKVQGLAFAFNPITTLIVPEGVEHFEMGAVANTNIEWVLLPESITYLGDQEYVLSVPTIYYMGDEASFRQIEITTQTVSGDRMVTVPLDGQLMTLPSGLCFYSETYPVTDGTSDKAVNYWHYVNGLPEKWA